VPQFSCNYVQAEDENQVNANREQRFHIGPLSNLGRRDGHVATVGCTTNWWGTRAHPDDLLPAEVGALLAALIRSTAIEMCSFSNVVSC
jgi:hypothetical protein